MNTECPGYEILDVTLQRGKEIHKFTFISEETSQACQ